MRSIIRLSAALALLAGPARAQTVVTFENATLAQPLTGANSFQNGKTLSPPGSFSASGAAFNNNYNPTFDSWSGWSYSNVTNTTTPGFGNQYAAYNLPGGAGAAGSANYAVAFGTSTPRITLPAGTRPDSFQITNTTYAALSMTSGDQFAKKFGGASGNDADFFLLTITGQNSQNQSTGSISFYLADYRFADNSRDYIVSQWATVDLTVLGADTAALSFGLSSSDNGTFGMNTPAYFAADNLVLAPVPEPATAGLVAGAGAALWQLARRRRAASGRILA